MLCYSDDAEAMALKKQYYNIEELEGVSTNLQEQVIENKGGGITIRDNNHLKEVLCDLYDEFTQTGAVACNSNGIEEYSRKIQVERMAELISKITE